MNYYLKTSTHNYVTNVTTKMSKKKIFIYISDVASFVGQNHYDFVTPFERLWKKCDQIGYNNAVQDINTLIIKKQVDINALELAKQQLKEDLDAKKITARQYNIRVKNVEELQSVLTTEIKQTEEKLNDVHLTQQQKLEKLVGEDIIKQINDASIETKAKRVNLDAAIQDLNLPAEKLAEVKKQGESFINKAHGTIKENDAIKMFEQRLNVKLDTSQQFNKLYLSSVSKNSEFDWFICGKVDGLYIDTKTPTNSYIVEVKNRTKSFFNTLRDYEKTQIHMYMKMLGIPRSKLVEKLDKQIRITEIYEDSVYTSDILEYLDIFISVFEKRFLSDENIKQSYILSDQDARKRFIQKMFLNPINKFIESKIETAIPETECIIDDLD